jgi:general stress protein CsbA
VLLQALQRNRFDFLSDLEQTGSERSPYETKCNTGNNAAVFRYASYGLRFLSQDHWMLQINNKLSVASMLAVVLAIASSLLGFPNWLNLLIFIFAVLLVLAGFIDTAKWVTRKNLDFWRQLKGAEKSEHDPK